jgi:hypothetical protein
VRTVEELTGVQEIDIGGTSIALDLIIIALPLPVLWKLQLRLKQKVLLARDLFNVR